MLWASLPSYLAMRIVAYMIQISQISDTIATRVFKHTIPITAMQHWEFLKLYGPS